MSTQYTNVGPIYITAAKYEAARAAGTLETGREYKIVDWEAQEKLVSGTNIKTINNSSILGSGNINANAVSVSSTGTATDTVSYITIDGTEKKINSGVTYTAGNGIDITNNVISLDDDASIAIYDQRIADANQWLTNGYTKTRNVSEEWETATANLPSVCTGNDKWGVLLYVAENNSNKAGLQQYFPIDGTYKGRVFYRSVTGIGEGQTPIFGDWNMVPWTSEKQDTLVSGTNIKTINSNSILGSGNISAATGVKGNNESSYRTGDVNITLDNVVTSAEKEVLSVTATELNYSSGLTGNIQSQLDNKEVLSATATELNYSSGLTGSIQTQLNAKQATLVSGTNIKTINGNSILGSGNITTNEINTLTITSSQIVGTEPLVVQLTDAQYNILADANVSVIRLYSPEIEVTYPIYLNKTKDKQSSNEITFRLTKLSDTSDFVMTIDTTTKRCTMDTESYSGRYNITIAVSDWNGGTTCTKSVAKATASCTVFCDSSNADVQCTGQAAGTLTFTATSTPTTDTTIKVVILP